MTRARRGVLAGGCALAWLALSFLAAPAAAEIKTRVAADGTIEIYNDGLPAALARPQTLRPVPQPTWEAWIRDHAASHGMDPRLVQAVIQAESAYNPRAVSSAGALGLMQLMPATARQLSVAEPLSPEQNIRGGVAYLRQMLDRFGSVELAVAAYNAGPGAVERYRGIPPYAETRAYVQRVMGLYRGGSTILVGFSGGGGPSQPHALVRDAAPSMLQRALAAGALPVVARSASAPPGRPAAVRASAGPSTPAAARTGIVTAAASRRAPGPAATVAPALAAGVTAPSAVFAGGG